MAEIKFIADVMVGKLARWLRVLGFDVAYSNKYDDDEILRIGAEDNRIILTRDNPLAARVRDSRCLFIESDAYKEQIQQVLRSFDLKDFAVFSRQPRSIGPDAIRGSWPLPFFADIFAKARRRESSTAKRNRTAIAARASMFFST